MQENELCLLRASVAGLKMQNRLLVAGLVLGCAFVCAGWQEARERTLRATKLELINDEGNVMGELEANNSGVVAQFRDAQRHPRVVLTTASSGTAIGLRNPDGTVAVGMASVSNNNGLVITGNGSKASTIVNVQNSLPSVSLVDKRGVTRASLTIDSAGGALGLNSSNGKPLVGLFASDQAAGLSLTRNGAVQGAFANALGTPQAWMNTANGTKRDFMSRK